MLFLFIIGMKRNLYIVLATVMLLVGCKQHTKPLPDGILDTATMTQFMTEVIQLESFYAQESKNQLENLSNEIAISYDNLLADYNLTPESFEANLNYYSKHSDLYDSIHQRIIKNLKIKSVDINKTDFDKIKELAQ